MTFTRLIASIVVFGFALAALLSLVGCSAASPLAPSIVSAPIVATDPGPCTRTWTTGLVRIVCAN